MHRAIVEVDLAAITANVKKILKSTQTSVMAVVKADGYGHGRVEVAHAALSAGALWVGVALLEEAISLRTHGISSPLIAWLTPPHEDFDIALKHDIDLSVSSYETLNAIVEAGKRTGILPRIHIEVDTGMTRGGVLGGFEEFISEISELSERGQIDVVGFWTHFARADEPRSDFNQKQLKEFERKLTYAESHGVRPRLVHCANSAAALTNPDSYYNMLRLGIAMYGLSPDVKTMGSSADLGLLPAMTVKAELQLVKDVPAGSAVGYGGSAITERGTKIGVVAMGYADGIPRTANNLAGVFVAGKRAPLLGRVSMDQFVVDLGESSEAKTGDQVIVFGPGLHGEYTADDWGSASGTINYEIVTRIAARVPRLYNRGAALH